MARSIPATRSCAAWTSGRWPLRRGPVVLRLRYRKDRANPARCHPRATECVSGAARRGACFREVAFTAPQPSCPSTRNNGVCPASILETAHDFGRDHVSGDAHDKELPEVGVEDQRAGPENRCTRERWRRAARSPIGKTSARCGPAARRWAPTLFSASIR